LAAYIRETSLAIGGAVDPLCFLTFRFFRALPPLSSKGRLFFNCRSSDQHPNSKSPSPADRNQRGPVPVVTIKP
jgi:hypothetical protein